MKTLVITIDKYNKDIVYDKFISKKEIKFTVREINS